jgi:hypothetical protein
VRPVDEHTGEAATRSNSDETGGVAEGHSNKMIAGKLQS